MQISDLNSIVTARLCNLYHGLFSPQKNILDKNEALEILETGFLQNDFYGLPLLIPTFLIRKNVQKELGDTCLFVTGVFPNYRKMQRSYYQSIGIGSYNSMNGELFDQLATHFNVLGDFIDLSLRSSKRELNNLFR